MNRTNLVNLDQYRDWQAFPVKVTQYHRFQEPHSLCCQPLISVIVRQRQSQTMCKKSAWMFTNKTFFTKRLVSQIWPLGYNMLTPVPVENNELSISILHGKCNHSSKQRLLWGYDWRESTKASGRGQQSNQQLHFIKFSK